MLTFLVDNSDIFELSLDTLKELSAVFELLLLISLTSVAAHAPILMKKIHRVAKTNVLLFNEIFSPQFCH
ncbi:MAG: hypothetical protein K1X33_01595 [Methanobacteriaceae archaeon]|nr:hypothetical protein [Methanobacteriaceae archaeon]